MDEFREKEYYRQKIKEMVDMVEDTESLKKMFSVLHDTLNDRKQ